MCQCIDHSTYQLLLDRFVRLVRETLGDRVISIVLYGSVARGTAGPKSDVDVLLVLEDAEPVYRERLRPLLPILRRLRKAPCWQALEAQGLPPFLSLLVLSRAEADQNRYLYLDMLADAHLLIDRGRFFQNRLEVMGARLEELGAKKIRRNGGWYWDLKPDLAPNEVVAL